VGNVSLDPYKRQEETMLSVEAIHLASREHLWLGTQQDQRSDVPVVGVVIGKAKSHMPENGDAALRSNAQIRDDCILLDPTIFFFERGWKQWELVSIEKVGREPYVIDPLMNAEYFNRVRHCSCDEAQKAYFRTLGLLIDGEPVAAP
jgi:hypothetical protein